MEKIYLTDAEKQEILNVQEQENNFVVQLGQLEYDIQNLELQKDSIIQSISEFNQLKKSLAKQLQDKYGEGTFDLNSGEFVKNN